MALDQRPATIFELTCNPQSNKTFFWYRDMEHGPWMFQLEYGSTDTVDSFFFGFKLEKLRLIFFWQLEFSSQFSSRIDTNPFLINFKQTFHTQISIFTREFYFRGFLSNPNP
jgi:hypothetical protein